jgi:hypothetical protein
MDTGVSINQEIIVEFTEPMEDVEMVEGFNFMIGPDPGGWLTMWTDNDQTLTMNHDDFTSETWYEIILAGGDMVFSSLRMAENGFNLYDKNGNPLDIDNCYFTCGYWAFQTNGSGSGLPGPRDMSILINDDDPTTETTDVDLKLWANYATEMMISNDPSLSGADWEPFDTHKDWVLTSSPGTKTVYAKYKSYYGEESEIVSDDIELLGEEEPGEEPGEEPTDEHQVVDGVDYNDARYVKTPEHTTVYLIDDFGVRHAYPHYHVWESYFGDDYSAVEIIPADELAMYPLGRNVPFNVGTLMKLYTVPKVYLVQTGAMIHWIVSEAVAEAHYGTGWPSLVYDLPEVYIGDYTEGDPITE